MYDVGAAGGVHATLATTVEGVAVTVHTFEMQPSFHSAIERMAAELLEGGSRIIPHLAGLCDHHEGEFGILVTHFTKRDLSQKRRAILGTAS